MGGGRGGGRVPPAWGLGWPFAGAGFERSPRDVQAGPQRTSGMAQGTAGRGLTGAGHRKRQKVTCVNVGQEGQFRDREASKRHSSLPSPLAHPGEDRRVQAGRGMGGVVNRRGDVQSAPQVGQCRTGPPDGRQLRGTRRSGRARAWEFPRYQVSPALLPAAAAAPWLDTPAEGAPWLRGDLFTLQQHGLREPGAEPPGHPVASPLQVAGLVLSRASESVKGF